MQLTHLAGQRTIAFAMLGGFALASIAALVALGDAGLFAVVALCAAIAVAGLVVVRPEIGALCFAGALYANLPANLGRQIGSPMLVGLLVMGLLAVTVFAQVFVRRAGWRLDRTFLLMVLFLAVTLASALQSHYPQTSAAWITGYVREGLLIFVLCTNAIRSWQTLRRVLWVVVLTCALLGGLSLFQELTGNYEQKFLGLAQRNTLGPGTEAALESATGGLVRERDRLYSVFRAGGPVGDPNRYGQLMLVMVPIALLLGLQAGNRWSRLVAFGALLSILAGISLTYSRGTFMALVLLLVLFAAWRFVPGRVWLVGTLCLLIAVPVIAPGTLKRLGSIGGAQSLVSESSTQEADGATRGRVTEMLAALRAFRDHPILGLGPGTYTQHYSIRYMSLPEISFRTLTTPRRAHTLYFEMGAEIGALGLMAFLLIPALLARRLWKLRARAVRLAPQQARVATAFLLALAAYFMTALFLHMAFQPYYWFLIALCTAATHCLEKSARNGWAQA